VTDVDKPQDKHLGEDDLVLHRYNEHPEATAVDTHLSECEACRARYAALARVLDLVTTTPESVPEPDEGFESRMWARLEPRLERRRPSGFAGFAPQRLAVAGAIATLVVAAFVAGRYWHVPPAQPGTPASSSAQAASPADRAIVRERILLVAIGDHLDRSQMALIEISNAEPDGPVDIGGEQERVRDLVASNRLLRQTVEVSGDAGLASVLDDLERVLLDIAHGPSELDADQFGRIRERIESQGLIFKMRVAGSAVREREATVAAGGPKTRS